jgi:hypothetical protein
MKPARESGGVIFRRFRRVRGGRVLDAHKYGYRAWPMRMRMRRPK